ncbi:Protein ZBED8-like [Oopsacas minuta]|uniref:Protein ZBED8-like n=1 Tax=Oopsacas minuta TaxID=111878 RepID=A0AAV7JYM8_9METZ|nr:Protein ZBED8-like [Oopsacas minuta]
MHKVNEFGVNFEKDIVAIITDGCSMMKKLRRSIASLHQLCYADGLQLVIQDTFYQKHNEDIEIFSDDSGTDDEDITTTLDDDCDDDLSDGGLDISRPADSINTLALVVDIIDTVNKITERNGTQKPQCVLCGIVLANGSLKPAKLKEHLTAVHPDYATYDVDSLRTKKARFEKTGTLPKLEFCPTQKPCLEASYKVAYRIAKQRKPHTICDTLIKPCALDMVELVYGLEQRKKIEAVPLSNHVIHSRIVDISSNILKQIIKELADTPFPFSMQLGETTDITQCSQLLVFVRYAQAEAIKEEFPFCEPLMQTTKATDIFEKVQSFFAMQNFDWKKKLGSLCIDEHLRCLAINLVLLLW